MENLVWQKIDTATFNQNEETVVKNEFDNDAATLQKEWDRFQSLLNSVTQHVYIHHLDNEEGKDLFVLSVESMDFVPIVNNLFSGLGPQYAVSIGDHRVPMKGFEQSGMCPRQGTLAITRVPQRNLNRTLPLSLSAAALYLVAIVLCLAAFYRIVIA